MHIEFYVCDIVVDQRKENRLPFENSRVWIEPWRVHEWKKYTNNIVKRKYKRF